MRTFLAQAGEALAGGDAAVLSRFFEGGASYPRGELERLRASRFWTFRPAARVKRLGPDAFTIRLLPEHQPERRGAIRVRVRLDLPVRRGRDGQLRILTHEETERLEKLPVPEAPEGGEVVALEYPEEGDLGWEAGKHYATELRAEARPDQVRLQIRFTPPLTGPGLTADAPLSEHQMLFSFGHELRVEMSLDADANEATGARLDELYRRLGGSASAQRIEAWRGFGADAKLRVDGRKFVETGGSRAWGFHVKLGRVAPRVLGPGSWSDEGEVLFEKTQADPEIRIEGDLLTIRLPAGVLPMTAGHPYRVMLEGNSSSGPLLKARKGRVGSAVGP